MEFPFVKHLPSASELLDSPPLRKLAERLGEQPVLGRVRTVLEQWRSSLQHVSGELRASGLRELAERLAHRIQADDSAEIGPVFNCTGQLFHDVAGPPPLAEAAVVEMALVARESYGSASVSPGRAPHMAEVQRQLAALAHAETALVLTSEAAATTAALAVLASGHDVVVAREQMVELAPGFTAAEAAGLAGVRLREVGAVGSTTLEHFAQALTSDAAVVLSVDANHRLHRRGSGPSIAELATLAHQRGARLVHLAGPAPLATDEVWDQFGVDAAAARLKAGADLVIVAADGLVGGPAAGIVLGRRELVGRLEASRWAMVAELDRIRAAALAASLRLWSGPQAGRQSLPVWDLATTPVENLKCRAERLAPQIAACGLANNCRPETATACFPFLGPSVQMTWGVLLEARPDEAARLAERLRRGPSAILSRPHDEGVFLDLRSLRAAQDGALAASLAEHRSPASHEGEQGAR